ncbi:MAG: HAD family phosphatase [Caulobacteraceae bacterium]|nr:HAD family phosphatase [Caulobacteraceae bacterium]
MLSAIIFDVDGVLLQSPHEEAWRKALDGYADPKRFTTAMYQAEVAGKPRLEGARAALKALGVRDAAGQAQAYAQKKPACIEAMIRNGGIKAYPDALDLVTAITRLGLPMAAASASKNANEMMAPLKLASGKPLLSAFAANLCGVDVRHGKPGPDLYLAAAGALGEAPQACVVFEDAPVGIEAALAGRMAAVGVARLGDQDGLHKVHADLVVKSLDDIAADALAEGRLAGTAA